MYVYLYIDAMKQCNPRSMVDNYHNTETTLKVLHCSLVSGFWRFTRTIQGISTFMYILYWCIYMRWLYPRSMVDNDPKLKRLNKCYAVLSCLGFESLEQYKASEALVSWSHCVRTTIYICIYTRICKHVCIYIYICDEAINPRSMVENDQNTETTYTKLQCSLVWVLGNH